MYMVSLFLCQNYREARQPLNDLIQVVFPTLQQLMTQVLENNTIEAAQVMRVCLKIFWSATQYQVLTLSHFPPHTCRPHRTATQLIDFTILIYIPHVCYKLHSPPALTHSLRHSLLTQQSPCSREFSNIPSSSLIFAGVCLSSCRVCKVLTSTSGFTSWPLSWTRSCPRQPKAWNQR